MSKFRRAAIVLSLVLIPFGNAVQAQGMLRLNKMIKTNVDSAVRRHIYNINVKNRAPNLSLLSSSANSFKLYAAHKNSLRLWDVENGAQYKISYDSAKKPLLIMAYDNHVLLSHSKSALIYKNIKNNKILWETDEKETINKIYSSINDDFFAIQLPSKIIIKSIKSGENLYVLNTKKNNIIDLKFDFDKKKLITLTTNSEVKIVNIENDSTIFEKKHKNKKYQEVFWGEAESSYVLTGAAGNVYEWPKKRKVAKKLPSKYKTIKSSDGYYFVYSDSSKSIKIINPSNKISIINTSKDYDLEKVSISYDSKYLIVPIQNKDIELYSIKDNSYALTLISTRDGWAVIDRKGRYDGSDGALNNIQWISDNVSVPIDNFTAEYYEPYLLSSYFKTEAPENIVSPREGLLPLPTALITRLEKTSALSSVLLSISLEDTGGGVTEYSVYQNGKLISNETVSFSDKIKKYSTKINQALVSGNNVFYVSAKNSEGHWGKSKEYPIVGPVIKEAPSLYLVTIGLDKYKFDILDLSYAVKDADSINDTLTQSNQSLFQSVISKKIINGKATEKKLSSLKNELINTKPEDIVIIYVASHGEFSEEENEFYVIPWGFDPYNDNALVEYGVSSKKIYDILLNIGANRIALFLDTCKSGSLVNRFDDYEEKKRLRTLSANSGIHVLSATSKDQVAVEADVLGHGAFTFALLDGLNGKADTAPADGNISMRELSSYAEEMVPKISSLHAGYEHKPMMYSRGQDFVIHRMSSAQGAAN
jgi:hypothetical protein